MYRLIYLLILSAPCFSEDLTNLENNYKTSNVIQSCELYTLSNIGTNPDLDNNLVNKVTSNVELCFKSEPFLLSYGVIQVNIFIESVSKEDVVSAVVFKRNFHGDDSVAVMKKIFTSNLSYKDGSQTIEMNVSGEYRYGYVKLFVLLS